MTAELANTKKVIALVLIVAAVAIIPVVVLFCIQFSGPEFELARDVSEWGQVGDYFGGMLNPAIAFAALLAVVYAVYLQRVELSRMKAALDEQNFETRFFNALTLFNQSLQSVQTVDQKGREHVGYDALREALHEFFYKMAGVGQHYVGQRGALRQDFVMLIAGYVEQYLGSATPMMITERIQDIAEMIEKNGGERKAEYRGQFVSYLSTESKVWVYLFSRLARREVVHPEFGSDGLFLKFIQDTAPQQMKINMNVLGFIAGEIVQDIQENARRLRK
jgi:uncharacterized membrane protein